MFLYELWKPWRRFGLVCSTAIRRLPPSRMAVVKEAAAASTRDVTAPPPPPPPPVPRPQITANHRKSPQITQEAAAAVHVDWNEAAVSPPLSPPQ